MSAKSSTNSVDSDHPIFMDGTSIKSTSFLQLPKFLLHPPYSDMLHSGDIVLYSVIRDTMKLSVKNNRIDELGVYVDLSRESMKNLANLSDRGVNDGIKRLKKAGLIWVKNPGQGRNARTYLVAVETATPAVAQTSVNNADEPDAVDNSTPSNDHASCNIKNHQIDNSRTPNLVVLDTTYCNRNNNKAKNNKSNQNVCQSATDRLDDQKNFAEIIENAGLNDPRLWNVGEDQLVRVALSLMFFSPGIDVDKCIIPQAVVRRSMRDLDYIVIKSALSKLNGITIKPKKTVKYFVSVLYHELAEMHLDVLCDPELHIV